MVLLMTEFKLEPEKGYKLVFSRGHDASIKGVAEGKYQAAAVASDMLDRAIARGDVQASAIKTVYESERFPAAAIGYAYNLKPELADTIRQTILDYKVQDTATTSEFAEGVVGFAPVSYKDDWALVRKIDEAVSTGG